MTNDISDNESRPVSEVDHHRPLLVWDDYHGFVVGRRQPDGTWRLDLPYGFEQGGKEIAIQPRLWWPLPAIPRPVEN